MQASQDLTLGSRLGWQYKYRATGIAETDTTKRNALFPERVLSRKQYDGFDKIVPADLRGPISTTLVIQLTHLPHDNARADETVQIYLRWRRRSAIVGYLISWGWR